MYITTKENSMNAHSEIRIGSASKRFDMGVGPINCICKIPREADTPSFGDINSNLTYIGTGGCCFGFLVGLNDKKEIKVCTKLDFNVYGIRPIIIKAAEEDWEQLAFLVWGSGCHNNGVRFVIFDDFWEVHTIIPKSGDCTIYGQWGPHLRKIEPHTYKDKILQHGYILNLQKTSDLIKSCVFESER
jgi:hypothetical protein